MNLLMEYMEKILFLYNANRADFIWALFSEGFTYFEAQDQIF